MISYTPLFFLYFLYFLYFRYGHGGNGNIGNIGSGGPIGTRGANDVDSSVLLPAHLTLTLSWREAGSGSTGRQGAHPIATVI